MKDIWPSALSNTKKSDSDQDVNRCVEKNKNLKQDGSTLQREKTSVKVEDVKELHQIPDIIQPETLEKSEIRERLNVKYKTPEFEKKLRLKKLNTTQIKFNP